MVLIHHIWFSRDTTSSKPHLTACWFHLRGLTTLITKCQESWQLMLFESSDLLKGITCLILLQLFLSSLPKDLAPSPWHSAQGLQFRAWIGNSRLSSRMWSLFFLICSGNVTPTLSSLHSSWMHLQRKISHLGELENKERYGGLYRKSHSSCLDARFLISETFEVRQNSTAISQQSPWVSDHQQLLNSWYRQKGCSVFEPQDQ